MQVQHPCHLSPQRGQRGCSTVSSPFPWKVCLKKTGLRVTSTEAAFFHPELSPQEKGLVAKRKGVMQIKTWTSDLPPRRGRVPACMCQGSYPAWVGRCSGWKQADQGAVKSLGAAPLHPWELTPPPPSGAGVNLRLGPQTPGCSLGLWVCSNLRGASSSLRGKQAPSLQLSVTLSTSLMIGTVRLVCAPRNAERTLV